jgi:aminoglycoside/choline kinase family phosphotransferase
MAAPNRQTLTLSFFKITSTYHRPPRLAVEDSSTGLLLITDLDKSEKLSERTENRNDSFELP